jgi:hypothetical protein
MPPVCRCGKSAIAEALRVSELVRNHLVQLLHSLGSATPPIDSTMLLTLYDRKDYPAMLGWIKNSMRLDLSVSLRIVDSTKPSAPMWIETPKHMPSYGTRIPKYTGHRQRAP